MKNNVRLGDIAQIYSGGTPSRTNPKYWGGSIPWVKTTQIQNCVITENDIDEWITDEGLKKSSAKMVPKGTILMAMIGQGKTRGQVAILDIEAATNQNAAAIQLSKDHNRDYVYQQLLFKYDEIRGISNSSGQQNLNLEIIRSISFPTASLPEQTSIAFLLSTWDLAIENTERLIMANEKRYSWLVDQLILSPAKRNTTWKHKSISDVAERVQRKSDGGDYPILTISSASGFVLQEEKYSRFMAGKSLDDYTLLHYGEFAYNKGNSLLYQFGCLFPLQTYEQALVPHVYVCFKVKTGVDSCYLHHLFQADYLKPQLGALVNTGVRNNGLLNISPSTFMKVTVPLPPLEQQQQIAAILSTAHQEINLLKQQADALRLQKRGLMQKLLTGEWRVKPMREPGNG